MVFYTPNENEVILRFGRNTKVLSGYENGVHDYETQVKGKIDPSKRFTIRISKEIEDVTASYVQGFLSDFVNTVGVQTTLDNMRIRNARLKVYNAFHYKLV